MNQNTVLKITAALLSAVLLTACGKQPQIHEPTGATLSVSFDYAYRAQQLAAAKSLDMSQMQRAGDYVFIKGYQDGAMQFTLYDPSNDSEQDIFGYAEASTESHQIHVAGVSEYKGTYDVLYESYDVTDEYTYSNYTYYMERYDNSLKLVQGMDITEKFPEESNVTGWSRDGQGNYYAVANGTIYCYDKDLTVLGEIKGTVSGAQQVVTDMNGTPYAICYSGAASAAKLDPLTLSAERVKVEGIPEWPGDFFAGNEKYHLFCENTEGIFGLDLTKGTVEKVLDWSNSGFESNLVWKILCLPDSTFLISAQDSLTPTNLTNYRLYERTQEEMDNMQLITLATINGGTTLKNLVHRYNRQSEGHHIVIYDYRETFGEENYTESRDQFYSDLLEGRVPDIIETQTLDMEVIGNKNLFEDLRPWLKADSEISDETHVMNFFDALEFKGELTSIAFSYSVDGVMAKTKYIGDKTKLTMQDYLELAETMPESMHMTVAAESEHMLNLLCNVNSFVNTEKGECYFNSKEFIRLLELCSQTKNAGMLVEDDMVFREDKVMLYTYPMNFPYQYHSLTAGDFGGEDVRLVGKPVVGDEGNGGMFQVENKISVNRESLYKEQIWEFIKFCLSAEQQRLTLEESLRFPVNRTVLNEWMAAAMTEPEIDPNHHHYADDRTWSANGVETPIGPATQEEMDTLLTFIEEIQSSVNYNETILNIMSEEAQMYFAGDQTAEQAAKMIQSRVSLYLSEQF